MENGGGPSSHLRELLQIRQEDDAGGHRRNFVSGQTLASVMNDEKNSNLTVMDVLRGDSTENTKKQWTYFKKFGFRRGAGWCSAGRVTVSDSVMNSQIIIPRFPASHIDPVITRPENSSGIRQNDEMGSPENDATADEDGEEVPARMSLMSLLADSDTEMGGVDDEVAEDGDGDVESYGGGGGEMSKCCVCMVRNKGSAFIPCGHTFCRLCSREVWVKRGNCPLCNIHILEILDIF